VGTNPGVATLDAFHENDELVGRVVPSLSGGSYLRLIYFFITQF